MRYTEKWVWQNQRKVKSNRMNKRASDGFCHREETYIEDVPAMREYREKIRSIDTDKKASHAIRKYWHEVAWEWNNGKGIIAP